MPDQRQPSRVPPHQPKRWTASGRADLTQHTKTVLPIKWQVARIRVLQIGRYTLAITAFQQVGYQRSAHALPCSLGVDANCEQVIVRRRGVGSMYFDVE